ncbi:unnamed protein product [Paramecium sonneborni]|uniref:3'-5' exonuclease domain-containing protein n=1 Tax=Paramecium sonneborni TaxID=65129 RepID=A0A8S1P9Y3_9CILI|nr:unnamed protein product [Paramecium sonneborni]
MYINSENLLPKLQGDAFGIDIEFSNQRICLIQISDGKDIYLFDPIVLDLRQYMIDFFKNDAIKIFYSGAQDLKWLKNEYQIVVNNYCDLKILAQKESDQSLIALWKKYCGVQFEREDKKRLQRSDWFIRPLTEEQLYYAALDCKYLIALREILLSQYTEDEKNLIHFSTDLKEPKLLRYLKKQLVDNEDVLLPQKIYRHIKFEDPFQTDDQKIIGLIEQLTKKHHEDYKEQKLKRFLQFQEKFTTHKPVYSNCRIFSLSGQQLCFCDQKKIQWYVKNGLGEYIDEKSVKLNFDPVCEFDEKEMKFYNEERSNRCVICGASSNILKYQIIPYMYKHYLPNNYKSHRAHDVVILCARCHEKASALQDKKRAEVAVIYGVPLQYYGEEKQVVDKLTYLLKKYESLTKAGKPFDMNQYEQIRNQFKDLVQLPIEFNKQELTKINENLKKELKNSHGEAVVKKLDTEEKIEEFIMIFRKHFLSSMDPQFLPKEWAIDHRFKRNFGEKSVYFQKQESNEQQQEFQSQEQQLQQQ